jgi:hypothetical protein
MVLKFTPNTRATPLRFSFWPCGLGLGGRFILLALDFHRGLAKRVRDHVYLTHETTDRVVISGQLLVLGCELDAAAAYADQALCFAASMCDDSLFLRQALSGFGQLDLLDEVGGSKFESFHSAARDAHCLVQLVDVAVVPLGEGSYSESLL